MEDELRIMLAKPLASLPTFIDLGRLSKRIDVFIYLDEGINESTNSLLKVKPLSLDKDGNILDTDHLTQLTQNTSASSSSASSAPAADISRFLEGGVADERVNAVYSVDLRNSHAHYLAKVLKKVLIHLEPVDQHMELIKAVDTFESSAQDTLDLQKSVKELFSHFDENGRTVKIFKLINQAALSSAVTALKLSIALNQSSLSSESRMTKDVRTMEGWRIVIKITTKEICVSHIRKEQTLGKPMSPDYWDVKWRLDIHFNVSMSELTYTNVEILDMTFGPEIPAEMKTELQRLYHDFDLHNVSHMRRSASKPNVPNLDFQKLNGRRNYTSDAVNCNCILS